MKKNILAALAVVLQITFAQMSELDVRIKLELIHNGKIDQVRAELPSLQAQYPNDPGVKYLDAAMTEDGGQAVKKFQAIVDAFPKSEWADDALYKVYQYYYAIGLYKTAEAKQSQLNEQYPSSIYAKKAAVAAETKQPEPPPVKKDSAAAPAKDSLPGVQTAPLPAPGKYAVQVGVYSLESAAALQAKRVSEQAGRTASVFSKISGGKTVYAVAFEGFADEPAAKVFGAELKTKYGISWFVVKR